MNVEYARNKVILLPTARFNQFKSLLPILRTLALVSFTILVRTSTKLRRHKVLLPARSLVQTWLSIPVRHVLEFDLIQDQQYSGTLDRPRTYFFSI